MHRLLTPSQPRPISIAQTYLLRLCACLPFAGVLILVLIADCNTACGIRSLVEFVPGQDKTLHFLLIGGLAVPASVLVGWGYSTTVRMRCVVQGVVLMIGLSTAEEFSQIFLPTRTFDWGDLACNYIGIAFFGSLMAIAALPMRSGSVEPV